jgi:penicillin-insensitive murein endopeptidase
VRLAPFALSALSIALLSAPAWSGPPGRPPSGHAQAAAHVSASIQHHSRSIGSPTSGRLVYGARLADAPYIRVVPTYAAGDVRWGTEALVGMIDRAARQVRRQFPDAVLSVGHLSRAGGGELDRHHSHESGRDADIGYYVKNHLGKPAYADHFVAFQGDGTAPHWPGAVFDDARNWLLVAAMLTDPVAHVSHIFVATPLRARLLAYAERIGAPAALRQRAAEVMAQPRGALPHDDHFHVRISCPAGSTTGPDRCIEDPAPPSATKLARHRSAAAHVAHAAQAPRPTQAPARAPGPTPQPQRPAPAPPVNPSTLPFAHDKEPESAAAIVPVDDVDGPLGRP